jgi:XisH protein
MPAKDLYHNAVKQALIKDRWDILKENYELRYGGDSLYPDLAAEKSIAATRGTQQILVEVKSFLGRSFVADLQSAIGQYVMYQDILIAQNLNFQLYLAVSNTTYEVGFQKPLAQLIVQQNQVNLLIFDAEQEVVEQWINSTNIEKSSKPS